MSIVESMRACAAAGYRVMDLNFLDCTTFRLPFVTDCYMKWTEEIALAANGLQIEFSQAHAPFYNVCDASFQDRDFLDKMILRAVECAGILKIKNLIIHAGTDYATTELVRASKRKNREYFLPVIEYAQAHGVSLVFENLWDMNIRPLRRYTGNSEELVDFVDTLGAPVGICYDTDHATLMGQSHTENLKLIGKRLVATHISDCISIECDHILPYSGKTDWDEVTSALKSIGYTGDFTYEIHRYTQSLPDALVHSALVHSVAVGNHLISLCI